MGTYVTSYDEGVELTLTADIRGATVLGSDNPKEGLFGLLLGALPRPCTSQ
jgi:hypothetical protein